MLTKGATKFDFLNDNTNSEDEYYSVNLEYGIIDIDLFSVIEKEIEILIFLNQILLILMKTLGILDITSQFKESTQIKDNEIKISGNNFEEKAINTNGNGASRLN